MYASSRPTRKNIIEKNDQINRDIGSHLVNIDILDSNPREALPPSKTKRNTKCKIIA